MEKKPLKRCFTFCWQRSQLALRSFVAEIPNAKLLQKIAQMDGFELKIYAKYVSTWMFLFAFVFLSMTIFFATDYAWLPVVASVILAGYTIFALLALHTDRLNRKTEAQAMDDAESQKK